MATQVTIITSNVDPLHEMAGSNRVYKLHGDILQARCQRCGQIQQLEPEDLPQTVTEETLFRCECGGPMRPNVVWFGEYPREAAVEAAIRGIGSADVVLEVGTSGSVSYGFVEMAIETGRPVVRVNPDATYQYGVVSISEPAENALPALVDMARAS